MLTLAYGRSSQRIWCPHRSEAVPASSVSVTIYDDGGTVLATAVAASVGTLDTTLAAAATQGDRELDVASVTGISRDDWCAIVGDDGQPEVCQAVGVDATATKITLDRPLVRSYAIGDAVKSASVYYDLDATDTDTWEKRNYYQALFTCSSWDAIRSVIFRIVDAATENPITVGDVQRALPVAVSLRGADNRPDLEHHRDAAWRYLKRLLLAAGRDPATLKDVEPLREAGGTLAAAYMMVGRPGAEETVRMLAGDPPGSGGIFGQQWAAISAAPLWFDSDQDRERASAEMMLARRPVRRGR